MYNFGMATWIAHLRVAENLLRELPELDPAQFAIGSIAPDSGIPDEKWEKFTPPAEITHFNKPGNPVWDLADLDFYRGYVMPLHTQGNTHPIQAVSFRLGYFFHLVTDNLWYERIVLPTRAQFAFDFERRPGFIWEVKQDWYSLDFRYLRSHPESLFWKVFLTAEVVSPGLDFLPDDALQQRVDYIRRYYQNNDDETGLRLQGPFKYLAPSKMDAFVRETSQRLARLAQPVFAGRADFRGCATILELPLSGGSCEDYSN
jgi:hypothetical protein